MNARRLLSSVFVFTTSVTTSIAALVHSPGETVRVAPGELRERLVCRAAVVPSDGVANVRARVPGRARRVLVREGDRVAQGQLLAELEGDDLVAELARAEADERALGATAAALAEGARPEERTALEAELLAARAELDLARDRAAREGRLAARSPWRASVA